MTNGIAADLLNVPSREKEHISPRNQNYYDDVSSNGYPIHAPISPSSENEKCSLYEALEKVFIDENTALSALITDHRTPTSSNKMDELLAQFKKLTVTADESQLKSIFSEVYIFLNAFCSGYRNVLGLFKEQVERHRAILNTQDRMALYSTTTFSSDQQTQSRVDLVLAISLDLDGKQRLSHPTLEALKMVTKHPTIKTWFNNILDSRPLKQKNCRAVKAQATIEGMHAAVNELSNPYLFSAHSQDDEAWSWYAQLFSIRISSLEVLRPFLEKVMEESKRKIPIPVTKTVTVTRTLYSKKSGRCCLFQLICCGRAQ
ncbi:MAG: hypothetical protein NT128_04945 [Proteobacteria bacterium]|nr:hypothetical protein [Pseudomonadota bacterium]